VFVYFVGSMKLELWLWRVMNMGFLLTWLLLLPWIVEFLVH